MAHSLPLYLINSGPHPEWIHHSSRQPTQRQPQSSLTCSSLLIFSHLLLLLHPELVIHSICFTSNLINADFVFSDQNFHPSSLTLLLPVQLSSVYWHLIPSVPYSTLGPYYSHISLSWDLQSTDFAFFSLSAFSCLHFLWSPVAFYFKLPHSCQELHLLCLCWIPVTHLAEHKL